MIDVRVERPPKWEWIEPLRNSYLALIKIDFAPPSSGPEIELTFDARHINEAACAKQCRDAGLHVVATRPR